MAIRWGEIAGALLTFLVFVALPLVAINNLPIQIIDQLSSTGLDIRAIATEMAMLGLVVSAMALVKSMISSTSITYLVLDVSLNAVTVAFALLVIGAGNIGSFGLSTFSLKQGKVAAEITIDLRIFIWLTLGTVILSIVQSVARFREARAKSTVKTNPN